MEKEYQLVFSDTFDCEGAPDPLKWTHEIGAHRWGNKEQQYYTDRLVNCFVKDGVLTILAQKEQMGNCEYTSARLMTYQKASWQYGKFEIVAKLPKGKGSWPAIWMLSDANKQKVKWPLCGEIDIMEHVGKNQDIVHFSLHTGTYNHFLGTHKTAIQKFDAVSDQFHTYGIEWDAGAISFSVDQIKVASFQKESGDTESEWPFDQPFYLIMNIAVGGTWGGEIDESALPYRLEVKSVQVWQKYKSFS